MPPPAENRCATCAHFTRYRDDSGIGTCAKGGPEPEEGCSDVGVEETCGRYCHFALAQDESEG